ncbi:MAG: methyltransferase domain-containing protein [Clostridia bacterium]|nr:methyltransferase domain-containing protein [Clostridia bacterium]
MNIGEIISDRRKALGFTQQTLAERLNVSFQAISKWENGTTYPDIELLPRIATVLNVSIDALLGYPAQSVTDYDNRYKNDEYYWGLEPNHLCYEIMRLKPPIKPYKVLDIGCGEGKDAVFLARNGYTVTAFDASERGVAKARQLAEHCNVKIDFFKADVRDFRVDTDYDVIFSSGVFHYIPPALREDVIENLKAHTAHGGIHAINVFVKKPFIPYPPDGEAGEFDAGDWRSGELFLCYHDWLFHKNEERIFDCNSGGIPHKHCMDVLIAEKVSFTEDFG